MSAREWLLTTKYSTRYNVVIGVIIMQQVAINIKHFGSNAVYKIGQESTRHADGYANNVDASRRADNYCASTGKAVGDINHRELVEAELDKYTHIEQRKARGNHGGRPRKVRCYNDNNRAIRADANWLSGCIITLQRETALEWGAEKVQAYFRDCSEFLERRYGHKISDVVHRDEDNPHMHYYFVPLDERGHLNTDGLFKRRELKQLHTDLAQYLQERGYEVERGGNTGKQRYTKSIKALKAATAAMADRQVAAFDSLNARCNNIARNGKIEPPTGFLARLGAAVAGIDCEDGYYRVASNDMSVIRDAALQAAAEQERADKLAEQAAAQAKAIAELRADNERLERKYRAIVRDLGGRESLDEVRADCKQLRMQLDELEKVKAELDNERAANDRLGNNVARLKAAKNQLEGINRANNTTIEQLRKDNSKVQCQLSDALDMLTVAGAVPAAKAKLDKYCDNKGVTYKISGGDGGICMSFGGKQRELER